ncbi:MAG: hypothetical protein Q4E89_09610 [Eubacteriales bacterium]|nr:hypothetical protein [Eubacteriales bacterium]
MKKGLIVLMIIACFGLGGGFFYAWQQSDRTGPDITFPSDNVYSSDMTEEELLEGVTAEDEKDGDVTDSLLVENIFLNESGDKITVVYTAKDSSNNVTKVTRQMDFGEQDADSLSGNVSHSSGENAADEEESSEALELTPAEEARRTQEAIADNMPEGSPRIYLTEYYVEISVGQTMDYLQFVSEIQDDSDDVSELWRAIHMDGAVDENVPGTYRLLLYVIDSNGHVSNQAALQVIVKGEDTAGESGEVSQESENSESNNGE